VKREEALELARAVVNDSPYSHANAVALALHVINQDIGDAFSPSASPSGGGASPAAPGAPVSTQGDAASPARNLVGPSGPLFPREADTLTDLTNAASVPTVYPTAGMGWQDDKIATWLESHAAAYEHGNFHEVARALRKKAHQIRLRAYLES